MKTKHGVSKHKGYHVWRQIINRCYDINHKHYKNYGNRGITVYKEWKNNVKAFLDKLLSLLDNLC